MPAVSAAMGFKYPKDRYVITQGGEIGKHPDLVIDGMICQVASCLSGRKGNLMDPVVAGTFAHDAIVHYAGIPIVYYFFTLPYLAKAMQTKEISSLHAKVSAFKGIEGLIMEMFDELKEGEIITDLSISEKIKNIFKKTIVKEQSQSGMLSKGVDDVTLEPVCANCRKEFKWDQAYKQHDTPESHDHNPPGHGEFRPRVFCPGCGFLIAEWDIDRHQDRDRWKWYGENENLNKGKELPPSPLLLWGKSISPDIRATVNKERINIEEAKKGASKEKFIIVADRGDVDTVKSHIEAGVDINTKNYSGETALILASDKGHIEVVKVLINAGADINDQNVYGKHTALIRAALSGHVEIVRALLEAGADPTLRNQFGKTADDVANDRGHKEIVNILRRNVEASPQKMEDSGKGVSKSKEDKKMPDYSLVKDGKGQICGIWFRNPAKAQDQYMIGTMLTMNGAGHLMGQQYRVVPNKADSNGGCFVMFGGVLAPSE